MTKTKPSIQLSYEDGCYTIIIHFSSQSTIITDGKTFDELVANIDDALKCHFGDGHDYQVDLSLPMISFTHQKSNAIIS